VNCHHNYVQKETHFGQDVYASRKRRIATGSGVHVSEVNKLLKNYLQMQKMMKSMTKAGGLGKLMRAFGGRMPM
jgi:signal recognition particle subunit SRP54